MSRIFLSHSSTDEREAIALRDWFVQNGWDDVFLDLDPRRGLLAGERWQDALRRAADRCEVVVFTVTPAWARSKWCQAEFLLAKSLNKRIFGAILKPVEISELPTELTAEWQLCHLAGDGPTSTITFTRQGKQEQIEFLTEGLARLRAGLEKAGLDARYFPWPPPDDPKRPPYRGLVPLEEQDAAIYFGRDAQIVRGLDAIRGMRATGVETLFVILGPSGCGKSSFLRAGLLPRLKRDDRHFLPLPVIRPESRPITGERGLAVALHRSCADFGLTGRTLGAIKTALAEEGGRVSALLGEIRDAAGARLSVADKDAAPPTLILSIDQAEELFSPDATDEAPRFLAIVGSMLRDSSAGRPSLIIAFTIRSDRYEPLQTAPELTGLKSSVFDGLKPMPTQQFKEVITGPAIRATSAGSRLTVEPALVDRLLDDCTRGADTLPLLSLTLSRLYRDYGDDGDLRLDEYTSMGGMAGVVNSEVESVLAPDDGNHTMQLHHLRGAFVPWLATIDPESDRPMRRVARYADLPTESLPLIDALAEKRLLVIDQRNSEKVAEVAHEALLRQWSTLNGWLEAERDDLKLAHALEQATQDWQRSGSREDWLWMGDRLTNAENLSSRPGFRKRLDACREFLLASRRGEDAKRAEEERRRTAELEAAQKLAAEQSARADAEEKARTEAESGARRIRNRSRALAVALVAAIIALGAVGYYYRLSGARFIQATGLRLVFASREMLAGSRPGGDQRSILLALAAHRLASSPDVDGELLNEIIQRGGLTKLVETGVPVERVAMSPDGHTIAAGSDDESVRLWDAKTGKLIKIFKERDKVLTIAFSPDGNTLAVGCTDNSLRLWNVHTGKPVGKPFAGHTLGVTAVAFSPDGRKIVSGSYDNTMLLWDVETEQTTTLPGDGAVAWSVAVSPDGSTIVSGSSDNNLRLCDARSGRCTGLLKGHKDQVVSVAYSPDGSAIVSGSSDKTLRMWDANTGHPMGKPMRGHEGPVTSVAFTPDGRAIVSGSDDKTLRFWDAQTRKPIGEPLRGHEDRVTSISVSPGGNVIVSGSEDKTLRLWDAQPRRPLNVPLQGHTSTVQSIAVSPDGNTIVSGSWNGGIRLWDVKTGESITVPPRRHTNAVWSVVFSPDGKIIVSGSGDKTLRLWDAHAGEPGRMEIKGHENIVRSVAVSSDEHTIASGSEDKTVRLWDARTGREIHKPLMGHTDAVTSVAFSPDGRTIVSGSDDKTLRLWNAKTGEPKDELLAGHEGPVKTVAYSRDGRIIVSGSADKTLRLWDARTGKPIGDPFEGHEGDVTSVAFSPDGHTIISGSEDKTLRLWNTETGQPIGPPFRGHDGAVTSVAFTPDGTTVISGSDDRTLRRWHLPDAWPDVLCNKLTGNMSRKEWKDRVSPKIKYVPQCPGLPVPADEPDTAQKKP